MITSATGAVVLAHLRGCPAPETARIAEELAERGIPLVEDCAQAWGVTAAGRPAGGWGTVATFSMQTYKMIAVGEGGARLADNPDLLRFVRAVAGDTQAAVPQALWRGKHRMTEVSAALALPQLTHLDVLTSQLRDLQQRLVERLAPVDGIAQILPSTARAVAAGNGSLTGMWLSTATAAERLAGAYHRAGLRSWWPGPGDLHTAAAWPEQPRHSIVDIRRYLDIQTPRLPADRHDAWCDSVIALTTRALNQAD